MRRSKNYLYSVYGDEIRAVPPARGVGLLAWLAPFFFLVIGVVLIFRTALKKPNDQLE